MRPKKATQPPALDQNCLNSIYQSIVEKMQVLDKLNNKYKQKQQGHFLKTFMNVIEKMGSQLIFAQEAYRNVDLQARKDDYCLLLASQLRFYKDQTITLQELLKEKQADNDRLKIENGTLESELASMTLGFDMKVKECMKLRAEIRDLKRQIKFLSDPSKNSIFKFTNPEVPISQSAKKKSLSLTNYLEDGSLQLYKIDHRAIRTNNNNRKKNTSLTLQPKAQQSARKVFSKTPQNQSILFDPSLTRKPEISTHSSFRRKLQNLPYNRNALQSYQPSLDH